MLILWSKRPAIAASNLDGRESTCYGPDPTPRANQGGWMVECRCAPIREGRRQAGFRYRPGTCVRDNGKPGDGGRFHRVCPGPSSPLLRSSESGFEHRGWYWLCSTPSPPPLYPPAFCPSSYETVVGGPARGSSLVVWLLLLPRQLPLCQLEDTTLDSGYRAVFADIPLALETVLTSPAHAQPGSACSPVLRQPGIHAVVRSRLPLLN